MATHTLSSVWRRFAALMLVVVSLVSISCKDDEDSDGRFTATGSFAFREVRHSIVVFELDAANGTIEITGTAEQDSVIILAERIVRANNQHNADVALEDLNVEVGGTSGFYFVRTVQPSLSDGNEYEIHYHITLPAGARVEVQQDNGNVSISSINHEDTSAPAVIVAATNGNIELTDIRGSVLAQLVNGTITCTTQFTDPDRCTLTVVNGTINLSIPDDISATFSAQVDVGTVSVNGLDLRNPVITPTSVTGTLGSGDGAIALRGTTGTITATGN